jgi:glycosyltransferase involved in cell wall biosynthesis
VKTAWMYLSQPNVGGAQLSSLGLADGLRGTDWQLKFCISYPGPFVDECQHRGHPLEHMPMPEWYRFRVDKSWPRQVLWFLATLWLAAKTFFYLRRKRPDLIYLSGRREVIVCAPSALLLRIPLLYHLHGFGLGEMDFLNKLSLWATRLMGGSAVCNSQHTLETARGEGWRDESPIIYNGFHFDQSWDMDRQEACRSFGIEPGTMVIGSASRISPGKNFETLLRAAAELKRALPRPFILMIAGAEDIFQEGRLVRELKALANELGIADNIRWLGHFREMGRFYRALDLFILPTAFESFGRVFVEAMAAGVPTIGTRVGGVPEIITDGVTGFFAPIYDHARFAALAVELLTDGSRAREISARAMESTRTRFSPASHTEQMKELFDRLVAEKAKARA